MALIELERVAKDFVVHRSAGRLRRERITVHAVEDLTFAVERGTILGYIGPNGAGKSTTVKMLTGILVPTAGRVSVGGLVPWDDRIALARRIGVMFGQRVQLWWDLPLVDSLELLRHMYRVPADRYRDTLASLREALDLDPFMRTPVRQLSLGQRIRGELAAAMLHDPEILFLDEPTIGLDVVAKQRVREFLLRANRERGVTVMLTTHDLADIERLCSRILRVIRVDGPRQWIAFERARTNAAQLVAAVATRASLRDLTVEEPEIDDVVRRIYSGVREAHRPS